MDILFISNIPSPYNLKFLEELGKRANVLAVFERATSSERDKSWADITAENFECIILKGINIGVDKAIAFDIKKYIKKYKEYKIIIANPLTPTGIIAIDYCRRKKIKYALQSEGGMAKSGKGLKEKFKKWVISGATLYLSGMSLKNEYFLQYGAPSEKVKQYPFTSMYDEEILSDITTQKEKDDFKKELSITENRVIISVGRFIYCKGYDILLKAFQNKGDDVGLYLVGGKPTEELLEIEKSCNLKNIHYLDFMNKYELAKYYKAADLFVLATRGDTWGLVINEAMAKGLPVITTDMCVAGVELIENGINGYIVESENVEQLREKLDYLMDNPAVCREMGRNNLDKIKPYSYENMAENHIKVLEQYL